METFDNKGTIKRVVRLSDVSRKVIFCNPSDQYCLSDLVNTVQCSNQGDIITILNRCTFAFEIKNKQTPTTENKLYEKYCTNDTS